MIRKVVRGDRLVGYPSDRPKSRVFIEVRRVAKDGSWADIACYTWAIHWTKRQPLPIKFAVKQWWDDEDLLAQEADHVAWLKEEGIIK